MATAAGTDIGVSQSSEDTSTDWKYIFAICLVVFLAIAFRVELWVRKEFWFDELYTLVNTKEPSLAALTRNVLQPDVHPPLYNYTAFLWSRVFGTTLLSLRAFSFGCSMINLGVILRIGRDWLGRNNSVILGFLFAVLGAPIYFSSEARAGSFSMLLATLLLWSWATLLFEALQSDKSSRWLWGSYACLGGALMLTTYVGIPLFGATSLALLGIKVFKRQQVGTALLAVLGGILIFSPWLPTMLVQIKEDTFWSARPSVYSGFRDSLKFLYQPGSRVLVPMLFLPFLYLVKPEKVDFNRVRLILASTSAISFTVIGFIVFRAITAKVSIFVPRMLVVVETFALISLVILIIWAAQYRTVLVASIVALFGLMVFNKVRHTDLRSNALWTVIRPLPGNVLSLQFDQRLKTVVEQYPTLKFVGAMGMKRYGWATNPRIIALYDPVFKHVGLNRSLDDFILEPKDVRQLADQMQAQGQSQFMLCVLQENLREDCWQHLNNTFKQTRLFSAPRLQLFLMTRFTIKICHWAGPIPRL